MSKSYHKDETISALIGKFKERISEEITYVDLSEIDSDLDEIWCFHPATGTQADAIIKKVSDGSYFAAQVEAIFQRCYDQNGKKRFRPADKEGLLKLDPEFIASISERIGAFDDLSPDVDDLAKNSNSTTKQAPSSPSVKD
jgi:hypothetical protein